MPVLEISERVIIKVSLIADITAKRKIISDFKDRPVLVKIMENEIKELELIIIKLDL